jgi:SNF2 family DNA or RNA helicase
MSRKLYTPRPYQGLITSHIMDVARGAVFAGMGMGKTISTLTALDNLFLCGADHPVLILAPLRVARTTWPEEVRKWDHLRHVSVMPIVGSEAERRQALKYSASVYTTNYDQIPWLVEHFGKRWPFEHVVSDESTRLKGFRLKQGTKRARALAKVAHTHIKRFTNLTGTPAPNGLQDLWGQTWFLDAGQRLGRTYSGFRDRYFSTGYDGFSLVPTEHAQTAIQDSLRDICLTINSKDWFDLKEPIVNNIYIDLPPAARRLYDTMEKEFFIQLESGHEIEAFNAAARTQKLLQIANGACYVDPLTETDRDPRAKEWKELHNAKIEALEDIIEEASGTPVLVAYQFKSDLARLLKAFPRGRHLDKEPSTIRDWNAGKIPVLFAHPQSAGHGLNLQDGGNILAFFGFNWSLEDRLQIVERIGPVRQLQAGYDRNVFIHNIIARDTVDELVIARVETKREVQDILLDALRRRH